MEQSEESRTMTKQQAREAAAVMLAWAEGKQVEYSLRGHDTWEPNEAPCWSWAGCDYRIKPSLRPWTADEVLPTIIPLAGSWLRPWTADEVPLGAWIRFKKAPYDRHLLGWVSVQADRELWLQEREHSTDGGKTWLPCGVMEESK